MGLSPLPLFGKVSCFPVFTQIFISVKSDVSVAWTAGILQGSFLHVLSSLPKLKVGLSAEPERMGLHSTHAVQLQAHISSLTCCLWQADLSFLPRSQLAATELNPKPSQLSTARKPVSILPGWTVSIAGFIGLYCFMSWWPDLDRDLLLVYFSFSLGRWKGKKL